MNFRQSKIKNFINNEDYTFVPAHFIDSTQDILTSIENVCNEAFIYEQLFKVRCKGEPYSIKNAEAFLDWAKEGFKKDSYYVFFILNSSQLPIGAIDIKSNDKEEAEIGYWLSSFHSGLMTNAVIELCKQAKSFGFKNLYGLCELNNLKSKSVLKRAKFADAGKIERNQKSYYKLQIKL
ncbi:GNAT family N-acetyltransferase [Bacteriovoracales bacterium]|nr:GNAT family N-acetyltransferase [Bacteriovoracales bacterium]